MFLRQELATPLAGSMITVEPDVNDALTANEHTTVIDAQPAVVDADALVDSALVLPSNSTPAPIGDAN